ncbi:uncharacterized protein LOC126682607 [Mercurialis annua]|uniref:uncharacterized protein LOC126682607 n=1 Tax=Mercurialis annua TaxID=3986 RepID=UPI0021605E94|nr:uncharacterized protein LOC126682607 [Mercurialis annua]
MFGCSRRCIFLSSYRADQLLKFVNPCVNSELPNYLQGQCCYYSMSYNKKMTGPKVRLEGFDCGNKQKTVTRLWRPISTLSNSMDDGGRLREAQCSASSSMSDSQQVTKVVEAVTEIIDSTISLSELGDRIDDRSLKEESIISPEKHSLTIEVGASLIRFIKGKGGSRQVKFEEEMGVKITLPSSKEDESVIIEGHSIDSLTRASEKIQAIIDEAVKSPNLDYSHFISLPLALHPELVDRLINFQNSILKEGVESNSNEDTTDNEKKDQESSKGNDVAVELKVEDDRLVKVDLTSIPMVSYAPKASRSPTLSELGIDRSIFINPKTFHLTVLMLKLWNKERVNAASEVLKSVSMKVMEALDNRPLTVRLKGLDCMRGPLSKARVIYATVEEIGSEDRLLKACQVIIDAFIEAGLVLEKDAKQKLKLHATLMNARHRKGKFRKQNDSFDARGIFKQFGSKEWGEYPIGEVHLSQRFVYDKNGYYHCCASIPFPDNSRAD